MRKQSITLTITATIFASLTGLAGIASADDKGTDVLKKADAALNSFKDGYFESKLIVRNPGGTREYDFTTSQKSPDKRLVLFTAPGDVKGMGILVQGKEVHVYLPGFQKVRRMGTHVKNQTFMGSNFGFDDFSQIAYADSYDAKILSEDDASWTVEMNAKKGIDPEFPKLVMTVDKKIHHPLKVEYYDASGKKQKTQIRSEYKQDAPNHHQPGKIQMIDHRRGDNASDIVFGATKIDQGLTDDIFTVRSLARGN